MNLPLILARSLPEAHEDLVRLGPTTAIVSIGSPSGEPPPGFQRLNPLHLRLEFHDVSEDFVPEPGLVPPDRQHVQDLLDNAIILRSAQVVYCHCNAGISRSTAVAYILRCLWMGVGHEVEALAAVLEDRPIARPNEILVRLADEEMGRGGAMLEALRAQGNDG